MNKLLLYVAGISFLFFGTVICLTLFGNLPFGHGFGDISTLMVIFFWLLCIGKLYHFVKNRSKPINKFISIMTVLIIILSIYILLRLLTIDRGSEYPWNGKIFL